MAEVLLFHHAQGLTPGVVSFADELRAAGHTVHTPDLFDGQTFDSIASGMAHIESIGFGPLIERGASEATSLPAELVYVGFSFGVLPAQLLAQTRAGARGAVLCYSCVPMSEFGAWPDGVPVQIHGMDADPIFIGEGDVDAPASSSPPPTRPSCSCIRATSTTSPTAACRPTTPTPPRCSSSACSTSSPPTRGSRRPAGGASGPCGATCCPVRREFPQTSRRSGQQVTGVTVSRGSK